MNKLLKRFKAACRAFIKTWHNGFYIENTPNLKRLYIEHSINRYDLYRMEQFYPTQEHMINLLKLELMSEIEKRAELFSRYDWLTDSNVYRYGVAVVSKEGASK